MIHKILDILTNLLLTIDKDGSKSIESEVAIVKNMFNIIEYLKCLSQVSVPC